MDGTTVNASEPIMDCSRNNKTDARCRQFMMHVVEFDEQCCFCSFGLDLVVSKLLCWVTYLSHINNDSGQGARCHARSLTPDIALFSNVSDR